MTEKPDPSVRSDLEGFLDDTAFNGVIFLLKEPNAGEGKTQKEFWFKDRLSENDKSDDPPLTKAQIPIDRSTLSKFKNRFQEMLTYVFTGPDKELRHAAYFNLRPDAGGPNSSKEFDELLNNPDYVKTRFENIVDHCRKRSASELTFFTWWGIFNKLKKYYKIPKESIKKDGVDYNGKRDKKRSFKFEWDGPDHSESPITITVYEILHPSRSPGLKVEE